MASSSAQPIKGAYYPSWEAQHFGPANIQTRYFTHIFYAFLNPQDGSFQFNIDNTQARLLHTFTTTLRAKSPPVKALFAVGGGDNEPATQLLARMASDRGSRAKFIRSSIDVARRFGFDGVDLAWEYPKNPWEMETFGALLKEWRLAVIVDANSTGRPPLLLTAAVYYTTTITWPTTRSYPVSTMSTNLDFINVMTYDYHGRWEPNATGAFAALYDPTSRVSTDAGINSWTGAGMLPKKLVMGLPLYGRTWRLVNPATSRGIGAPANGVVPGTDGVMAYAEVVKFNQANNARVVYDQATVSVYSVAGKNWISYDDPTSVRAKVQYARGRGLGGHFFWQVAGDYQWTLSQTASASW